MSFGSKLRRLRENIGKSQTEVAKEIAAQFPQSRMSQTTLSNLETKETAPRQEVLEILSEYYQVPITYFFEDETESVEKARTDLAREYLRVLRSNEFNRSKIYAHSTHHRREHDEVEEDLGRLLDKLDYDEDDEFLPT